MRRLLVKELMSFSTTQPTVVSTDATLRDIAQKLTEDRETREVYVVDGDEQFVGVITLRRLARLVFAHGLPSRPTATELLEMISVRDAGDIALKKSAYVGLGDDLEQVIEVMFRFDINEIPVVDDDRRIVGCLNMLAILAAWHAGKFDGLTG
jgi:CBS domain-containing protein